VNISFYPDGTARCLHSDLIPLQSIGRLKVRRASTVEFNARAQEWEVKARGKIWFHSSNRQRCLDYEDNNWESFA
jgi:hypothetical protein